MSSTLCPLYNEYNESLRWTFTEPLGTCIYNLCDEIAFIIGWLSVLSWTFALLPQIITNCKNKAAESQSFWFWILWLVGDFCNFGGCLLTKNLITNIALALVYLSFTAFACLQFIWYEYFLRKHNFNKQENAYKHHVLFGAPSPSTTCQMQNKFSTDLAMWDTPNFSKRYQALTINNAISPKLKKTLKILQRSPRMFALSSQLTKRMRREYEALQAQKRQQEQHFFPHTDSENENDFEYQDTITPSESPDQPAQNEILEANKSKSIIKIYENNIKADVNSISSQVGSSAPLRLGANPNYGSMSTIMSTLSTMTVTVVMLYGINTGNNNNNYNRRILLSESDNDNDSNASILMLIGMILGWTSSLIYISSRIPQLKLMLNTKAVSGINPAFFCLTFSGNLTQCLSMMINKEIYSNPSDLFNKLPWLSSSGVCIFQDGLILFLIYWYSSSEDFKSLSEINYSKGVMMPSPHYLITVNEEKNNRTNKKTRNKKRNIRVKSMEEKNWNYNNAYYEYRYGDGAKNNNNNPYIMTNTV